MKTLFIAAVAATMLSGAPSFAKVSSLGGTRIEITAVEKQKSFILSMTQLGVDAVNVKLENADGEQLTGENVKGADVFRKKYNMSNLAEGTYYLTLTKSNIRTVQPIVVTDRAVEIVETGAQTQFTPTFNMTADHKIDVNAMFAGYVQAQVKIYDNTNTVVFEKTLNDVFTLHQRFNVSALQPGAYTMQVSTPTESYYYSFSK